MILRRGREGLGDSCDWCVRLNNNRIKNYYRNMRIM